MRRLSEADPIISVAVVKNRRDTPFSLSFVAHFRLELVEFLNNVDAQFPWPANEHGKL
jgi:hypothetical protein